MAILTSIPSGGAGAILQSNSNSAIGYSSATVVNNGGFIINNASTVTGSHKINNTLDVNGNCVITGELTVDGVNIRQQIEKINERLAILVPDPALLERYEILQNLYSQYKMTEALCKNNEPK